MLFDGPGFGTALGVEGAKGVPKTRTWLPFWWYVITTTFTSPGCFSSPGYPQPVVPSKVRKPEAAEAFTGVPGCLWEGSLQASHWLDGVLFHWNYGKCWVPASHVSKDSKGQAISEYLSPSVLRCWNICWGWCGKHWDLAQLVVSTSRRAQHFTFEESPPGRDWFGLNRL